MRSKPTEFELDCVFIPVSDVNVAAEWYRLVLGAALSEYGADDFAPFTLPGLPEDLFSLMKTTSDASLQTNAESSARVIVGLRASNVATLLDEFREKGVIVRRVSETLEGVSSFAFRDPDGNEFYIRRSDED